jgi:hypothetical protein
MDWPMDPRRLGLLSTIPQATMILLAALVVLRTLATASTFAGQPAALPAAG